MGETCKFYMEVVIDLRPPDALGTVAEMSGETVMTICAAVSGAVGAQMAGRMDVVWSYGFAVGRERVAVNKALQRMAERGDTEAHRFKVPPWRPTAAERAPDATLLPPQADGDLRVLVWLHISAGVGPGSRGQALFRAAGGLEDAVRGFSGQHATVLRADAEPAAAEDKEAMRRFVDSCVQ